MYFEPAGGWKTTSTYNARLTVSDGVPGAYFGSAVSAGVAVVMVGAPYTTFGANQYQGAAYVFVAPRQTGTAEITSSAATGDSELGTAVATSVDGKEAMFGSPDYSSALGAAYIYLEPSAGWKSTASANASLNDGVGGFLWQRGGSGQQLRGRGRSVP